MKKRSVQLIFTLFVAILLVTTVSASIKSNKGLYHTKESVFVLSTVGINDNLCRSQNPPKNVKIHVVDHDENWEDGDKFEDIRGEPNEIPNSKFSNTMIWKNPQPGIFDLIVDCNEDGVYDEASEPIYSKGFEVVPKKGQGSMSKGHRSPQDAQWKYDPEDPKLSQVIYQVQLLATDEDLKLGGLVIETISPQEAVNLELHFDENNNGIVDGTDKLVAKYDNANKEEKINLDYIIRQDIDENFLVVINMNENSPNGKYKVRLVSLSSTGMSSQKEIKFFGNPLESNILTVVDKKTCIGELVLTIEPNPSALSQESTFKISGISGCEDKTIKIKSNECFVATGDLETCTLEADNLCEIKLNAVGGEYFACLDKDGDDNYNGFGESTSTELKILDEPKVEENNNPNPTGTKDETEKDEEPAKITGNVINNLGALEVNNTLLIVLEITLLLILIFLILIFYRVLAPKNSEPKKEEDDSDLFEELGEEKKDDTKEKPEKNSKKKK